MATTLLAVRVRVRPSACAAGWLQHAAARASRSAPRGLQYILTPNVNNKVRQHPTVLPTIVHDGELETLLEQQRRLHEEYERLADAMVKEKLRKKPSHRETINSEHRLKNAALQHVNSKMGQCCYLQEQEQREQR